MSRILTILLALVAMLSVARAESKQAAERYFRAGAKAYAAQNFAAAATNFDEAYKAMPMPEIAFSAAQAYRRLYQVDPKPPYVRRAVELYQFYLKAVKTGGRVGDAADNLVDMKRELAKLEAAGVSVMQAGAPPPQTRLGINVSVPDQPAADAATVREIGDAAGETLEGLKTAIDGKPVTPFTLIEVAAKEHSISVSADGYEPVEKKAVGIDGQSLFVDVELVPKPAKLSLRTEGGARISVDGRHVGTAPTAPIELAAGKHLVTVLRRGRETFGAEVSVQRGQELALQAPLVKTAQRKAVPWVLGGAGLLLAGAVTTGLYAVSRDNQASDLQADIAMGNRPPTDADMFDSAVRSRDRFATWTWVLGGAAVAAGGIGGLLFVFDRPSADSGTVGVAGRF